ncbi:MAG: amidase, partial [Xanthomonadales bacterium]|nr:amidase [Xanthomonadales bacterium]
QRMLQFAQTRSASDLVAAERELDQALLTLREILGRHDVLLTPATPQSAYALTDPVPTDQALLTAIANFAGAPAISVPMAPAADGLSIGLQAIGAIGSDLLLMALAERFEQLRDAAP